MSYIPPHKRHSKNPVIPCPFPDSLATKFMKNTDSKSSSVKVNIAYSRDAISKWFLIGPKGISDEVPPGIKLVPMSSDSSECRYGEKSFVLINTNVEKVEESEEEERSRWMLIAEKVEKDLVFAYEQAKKAMEDHHLSDNAKLRLVARFGKLLFPRLRAGPVTKNSYRTFCTDVPTSFIQSIKSKAIPSHEFCTDSEKEVYVVQISHYTRPYSTIRCKCTVKEDGTLSMYKASLELSHTCLNPLRHLVVDVSCIDQNLDMRLMLARKSNMMTLTEKETSNIQRLLDSATVDSSVKGGLRWPLGKPSSENGYTIFEVCHVKATTYKNRSLRLRVRETKGFSERFGTWEVERGVTLILQDINTKLQEQNIDRGCVLEMLRDALGTIWDFLHCDPSLIVLPLSTGPFAALRLNPPGSFPRLGSEGPAPPWKPPEPATDMSNRDGPPPSLLQTMDIPEYPMHRRLSSSEKGKSVALEHLPAPRKARVKEWKPRGDHTKDSYRRNYDEHTPRHGAGTRNGVEHIRGDSHSFQRPETQRDIRLNGSVEERSSPVKTTLSSHDRTASSRRCDSPPARGAPLLECNTINSFPQEAVETAMEQIRGVMSQYVGCADPTESAARKERLRQAEILGEVEETALQMVRADIARETLSEVEPAPEWEPVNECLLPQGRPPIAARLGPLNVVSRETEELDILEEGGPPDRIPVADRLGPLLNSSDEPTVQKRKPGRPPGRRRVVSSPATNKRSCSRKRKAQTKPPLGRASTSGVGQHSNLLG
ncbi:unnamed protein product [Eruca vesicaria subsp. sativa]|uniref:DUF7903 domain-containing protein n=1 Tax=Eruca vesicaria subsp. sativa TaxID=29727 RepID=A0ABC8J9R1_ERUVS|nr:unnamed protein product [Eruca vesicaria subsp. sativa]